MYHQDTPINSLDEDKLGRRGFAEELGNAILSYSHKESFVIGLQGKWGYGKTSIINMCLDHIKKISSQSPDTSPIIVRFEPWLFSGQKDLVQQFFKALIDALRNYKRFMCDDISRIIGLLIKYGQEINDGISIFTGNNLPLIGSLLLQKVLKPLYEADNTPDKVKFKLNKRLLDINRKIIIIIDDIDRLAKNEIKHIFQLVNKTADFDNTIYLLAYDRDVVCKALEDYQPLNTPEFLSKIVQMPLGTPELQPLKLSQFLRSEIDKIFSSNGIKLNQKDLRYQEDVYYNGFIGIFKTMRDVKRFLNTLRFYFPILKNEVNPIDFMALIAIQIFQPIIYREIYINKDLFLGHFSSHKEFDKLKNKGDREYSENKLKQIFDCDWESEIDADNIKRLIRRLFPSINEIYGLSYLNIQEPSKLKAEHRICTDEYFDLYFQFNLSNENQLRNLIELILEKSESANQISESLKQLLIKAPEESVTNVIIIVREYVEYCKDIHKLLEIAKSIIDIGDYMPQTGNLSKNVFDVQLRTEHHIESIVESLRYKLHSHDERFELLKTAIGNARHSIYTPVMIVHYLGFEHGKYNDGRDKIDEASRMVNPGQLKELESLCVTHIEKWAKAGKLDDYGQLKFILDRWSDWGDLAQARRFAVSLVTSEKGAMDLLTWFSRRTYDTDNKKCQEKVVIFLDEIKRYVNIDKLTDVLKQIKDDKDKYSKLEEIERYTLDSYFRAIEAESNI